MKLKSLFKDTVVYSMSIVLSKGIGFLLLPFYTRIFSPADYGVLDLVSVSIMFTKLIFSFQLDQAIARFFIAAKHQATKQSYATTALAHYIVCFSIASILIFVAKDQVSLLLFKSNDYAAIIGIASAVLFTEACLYILENQLKWQFESIKYATLSIIKVLISISLTILLAGYLGWGVFGVYVAFLVTNIIILVPAFIWTKASFNLSVISQKRWVQMSKFGVPLIMSTISILFIQYADRFFLSRMVGLSATGIYAISIKLSTMVFLAVQGFQMSFAPFVIQNYKNKAAKETFEKVFRWVFLGAIACILIVGLSAPYVLWLMTTQTFYEAYKVVPIMVASTIVYALGTQFSFGFILEKKTHILAIIYLIGAILNCGLNLLLIPHYEQFGAATATFLSLGSVMLVTLYISNKHYYPLKYPLAGMCLLSAATTGVLTYNQLAWQFQLSITVLIQKIVAVALILALGILIKIVPLNEIKQITDGIKSKLSRFKPGN